MDTNRLKRFATEARNILMQGVAQRLAALGFQADGSVIEQPELKGGGAVFMGEVQSEDFYHKWMSLWHSIAQKSVAEVAEEATYTWFNRLMAIRIMVKNELIAPILEYESREVRIPILVSEARQGRMPQMDEQSRRILVELLEDDSRTNEQFRVLIVAYCHSNPIINKCFGIISDYTELLLPGNILAEGGFVDMLNNTEFISEEDYRSPELIGWLYQFYISERKDEVFAKKGKFEADEIPAATQIFTPNWIVKYMVQNTVGRIYLDNNPYSDIKEDMKYLVEPSEPTPVDAVYRFDDIHELTCADLACGSGHILNECFDLLYQIYIEEGYNRQNAIEDIFQYNLTGIDLDTRAKQLATFALLMKACQKDNSFSDAHCMPKVYDMPRPYAEVMGEEFNDDQQGERLYISEMLNQFIMGGDKQVIDELTDAVILMNDAQNLGSIMKFDISERTRNIIAVRLAEYEQQEFVTESIREMIPYMRIILVLTRQYAALVMNPPYMGSGNMNEVLGKYVKENYEEGKADLCTVFVQVAKERSMCKGSYAFIIPPSWLFLSTFENLRRNIVDNQFVQSMLHLSRGVFGADFGAATTVIQNNKLENACGNYFRLVERTFQEFDQKHLQMLLELTLANHDFKYFFKDYNKDVSSLPYSKNGNRIYYPNVPQKNFEKIPGCPIGYWVSEKILTRFAGNLALSAVAKPCVGLQTADNARFLRYWHEVSQNRIGFGCESSEEALISRKKWFAHNKGGSFRKWYGNQEYVINWEDGGKSLKEFKGAVIRNPAFYFKQSVSWPKISSDNISFRYFPKGFIFDCAALSLFFKSDIELYYYIGYLNTKVTRQFLSSLSPTLNFEVGQVSMIPVDLYKADSNTANIVNMVKGFIAIEKQDWDAHETSWDFQINELLSIDSFEYINIMNDYADFNRLCIDPAQPNESSLEWRYDVYKTKWETKFMQLHANEEKLNRQFIEIYGLQDELTPDVPLDEITILQQGEISIEDNQIVWHPDVVIKQLISYAMGCMMGRYSIDKPGLILANQGDGKKEYEALVPNSRFEVDEDGIIPLMSANTEFTDNATKRFKTWLSMAFGEESLVDNLNFVERALGKSIDDYFVKDFWKKHKKMYQNRPIYWLFSSAKGAFQCLAYMHRMDAYTVERIRTKYLLPHIEWLISKQNEMQDNAANLSAHERKELDNIIKQIQECREYHDRLHVVADEQICFDLDDGVVVNYAKFGDVLAKLK